MPNKKVVKEEDTCKCHKGHGGAAIVLGVLVLANVYGKVVDWATFIGVILVLAGLAKLLVKK